MANDYWSFSVAGANKSELTMSRIQDKEKQGNYMCMVSVPNRDINCLTNIASLNITTNTYKPCAFSRKLLNVFRSVYSFTCPNPFLKLNSEKCNDKSFDLLGKIQQKYI